LNFYILLPLVLSAFSLILIAFVLKGHTQSRVHRLFSLYLFLLMLWGVFIFSMRASPTLEQAYFWEKTLMAVMPFVPVVFYHFAVSFIGINIRRWLLPSAYTIAVLFALISRTKLIMSGMETRPFGYAPVEGPAMIPLFLFCSAVMIMALHILWKSSRSSSSADERNRSTYIIFAICIFFLGNTFDFLPVLGLPLYPGAIFGNILFCLITTVTIVKYQLLDIRIVFRTGTAYFLMSAALAIPYMVIIVLLYQLLEQALPLWAYIVLLVLVALALQPLWWRVQRVVDRWFYRERYGVLRTLEDFSKETHKISDPNQLCSLLVKLIYRAVQSSNVHILLHSGPGDFRVISSTGENTSQRGLDSRSPLLRWLQSNKSTLLRQDLNIAPQLQSLTAKEMNELKQTKAELFVPIMTKEEELIGILILGQKLSLQPYSGEDERLILTVANRMAIELENSRLYQHIMESEEKLRLMYESMAEGVTVSDLDGNIVQMNETTVRMHGSDNKEALIGRSLFEFTAAKDHPRAMENLKRTIRDGYTRNIEYTLLRRDGSEFPAELSASVLKDTSGNPTGFVIIIEDLTERKLAEKELRESESRYRTIFESTATATAIIEEDTTISLVNEEFVKLSGYSREELEGKKSWTEFAVKEDLERMKEYHKLRRIDSSHTPGNYEFRFIDKQGNAKDISLTIAMIPGTKRSVASLLDITERKQIEEERQKVAKLESVDTLAGGIAHDFNNLLTSIMGNIGLAMRHVEPKSKAEESLLETEKASIRARDLTQQLLTFSKGGAPVKKPVSIAGLIKESAGFALRGSNIRCDFDLPEDLWPVVADEGQLSQVITNLVIDAQEVMHGGGVININASNTAIQDKSTLPLSKGRYVKIDIIDQGVGIKKKHLDRIFDPYFTTKQEGSGLGLATSYSIIKNHGGHITVESKVETGTTFHIYLPASKESVTVEKEAKAEVVTTGEGRILVMDDEEMIREMLSRMLSLAGYKVTLTEDGAEAIEQYAKAKESGKPFGAVIMDLTIPGGMGGKEAIKKLLEIDPGAKVIVSSGYATGPIMSDYKKYGFSAVVTKPYSAAQIEKTLHSIITKKGK